MKVLILYEKISKQLFGLKNFLTMKKVKVILGPKYLFDYISQGIKSYDAIIFFDADYGNINLKDYGGLVFNESRSGLLCQDKLGGYVFSSFKEYKDNILPFYDKSLKQYPFIAKSRTDESTKEYLIEFSTQVKRLPKIRDGYVYQNIFNNDKEYKVIIINGEVKLIKNSKKLPKKYKKLLEKIAKQLQIDFVELTVVENKEKFFVKEPNIKPLCKEAYNLYADFIIQSIQQGYKK